MPVSVGDHESELPLVALSTAGVDVWQLHKHLVPTFLQMHGCRATCSEVFVGESKGGVVHRDGAIGLLPFGSRTWHANVPTAGCYRRAVRYPWRVLSIGVKFKKICPICGNQREKKINISVKKILQPRLSVGFSPVHFPTFDLDAGVGKDSFFNIHICEMLAI